MSLQMILIQMTQEFPFLEVHQIDETIDKYLGLIGKSLNSEIGALMVFNHGKDNMTCLCEWSHRGKGLLKRSVKRKKVNNYKWMFESFYEERGFLFDPDDRDKEESKLERRMLKKYGAECAVVWPVFADYESKDKDGKTINPLRGFLVFGKKGDKGWGRRDLLGLKPLSNMIGIALKKRRFTKD